MLRTKGACPPFRPPIVSDLTLENVGKVYPGGLAAVAAMDLHVRDGEFLVLVGPSGCGKSTTLRMIAGLEDASCGTIRIGGTVVNRLPPRDRDVAMVFQSHALYPHMSVRENMAFGLRRRGCPRDEIGRRVAWAAELLGLVGLLDRKPHTLSGGQRQRVALGRAVVRRPKLFLLDEPLSNLDARLRTDTRAELKRLHRKLATTTLYVTHNQEEAMTLADRIAVLRGGRIQQCGTPLEVYNAPANRFVAGFIGTPAMNFIDGRLQQDASGQTWFESPCLRVPVPESLVRAGKEDRHLLPEGPEGCCAQKVPVPFSGLRVSLGIRPDNLQLQPSSGDTEKGTGPICRHGPEAGTDAKRWSAHKLDLSPFPASSPWHIAGTVEVVEPLGGTMDVHVTVAGGARLVCRVPAGPIRCNQPVSLRVDPAKIHLFAADA